MDNAAGVKGIDTSVRKRRRCAAPHKKDGAGRTGKFEPLPLSGAQNSNAAVYGPGGRYGDTAASAGH
ncbi:hypothetical protein EYF80_022144 [Liparis tanakae]|uniref:Uncharacterized protein n=1 Tax=Liparis tanakae TaxID=230148 RepID=A0A4Z2HPZ6_9TELE|nr:hypothetical protein EYF80_022144 [Liparis tanakae]